MTVDELPLLRSEGSVVGRLSPLMRQLRERGPVVKVRTRAGDEAWLVTRLAELKQLLKDRRIGRSHPDPENRPRYLDSPLLDTLVRSDDPEVAREIHVKTRAALTPHFSAKRMVALRERVAARVAEHLDRITACAPPVDLHAELSLPLSFEVLCDLLGVAEHDRFMAMLAGAGRLDESQKVAVGAQELFAYLGELVTAKRREPDEHLISALCEAEIDDGTVCELISTISFSYLVTPTNLSAGIALFASHPEQRERVVRDPGLLETAVEEVLRLSKVDESFQPRYADADIEIGDIVIKAGDLVLCDHYSPSFDDRVFDDPETFDVGRSPNPHLAFSHGLSHCIGAPLARIELQEVYGALLRRLPNLSLAVPIEKVGMPAGTEDDDEHMGNGIARLPATW